MSDLNAVNDDFNADVEEIRATISNLKEKKMLSYTQIGNKLGLNKAAVCLLYKGRWIPKEPEIISRILEKVRGLEE